jgi:NAD(P)-dependent dehydrogenase (short-subunit alcohol dehydrogenase family)
MSNASRPPYLEFEGKVVIVTGGAKGIGRAISWAFAEAGAAVVCADVDTQAGAALVKAAADLPGRIHFVSDDVSLAAGAQATVNAAVTTFGGLDILCNNVGIQPANSYLPAHEMPEEMWDRILTVNLKSGFLMSKYSIPHLRARGGGVIINTASVQGLQSAKLVPAYAASKGGMISLTQQLALEYAEDNIRVLAVNPGSIDTPLLREAINREPTPEEWRTWGKAHPLGRVGRPEEVANVVLFLASDRASFMTGEYVCVDGGLMAKGSWED